MCSGDLPIVLGRGLPAGLGRPKHTQQLENALRYNQRLWTFFQGEIAADDCALPRELRRNLLLLSAFIDRRTFEVIAAPSPEALQALIEINRQVMSALIPARPETRSPQAIRVASVWLAFPQAGRARTSRFSA